MNICIELRLTQPCVLLCSLYMEAATQGYAIAQSNIAVEYSTGSGAVEQNLAIGD